VALFRIDFTPHTKILKRECVYPLAVVHALLCLSFFQFAFTFIFTFTFHAERTADVLLTFFSLSLLLFRSLTLLFVLSLSLSLALLALFLWPTRAVLNFPCLSVCLQEVSVYFSCPRPVNVNDCCNIFWPGCYEICITFGTLACGLCLLCLESIKSAAYFCAHIIIICL